ncbi:MAG: SusC/RagA family TonB-linked outer membrane protein [Dysgonamonadaceae bacterium]|jgi:TonB-linked SusC/RagA family outer membrane protein|nr:SusC/RagA family TonB-linked outer membrane protein [Dysgonamonadaceae bacterium]
MKKLHIIIAITLILQGLPVLLIAQQNDMEDNNKIAAKVTDELGVPIEDVTITVVEDKNDQVNVAFGAQSKRRIVGAVSNIRMDDYKNIFNRRSFWTLVNAESLGNFSATDVRGAGSIILIDGLVRDGSIANLSDMLNVDEIEEITVLKDATSKMLYGALADKGIIMIKTRRGEANKRKMNFTYESGIGVPISYPNYLKAADYMILYNEALKNDGQPGKYSYDDIENTRNGIDPVKYPDVDYYRNKKLLNSLKPQQQFQGEFTGGTSTAQYYLNLDYTNIQSLLKEGEGDKQSTNRFNVHGAVDVHVTDFIQVTLDGTAIFNANHGPSWKNQNFWTQTTSERVNAYPPLIPIDRIRSEDAYLVDEARSQHSIINDAYLVGGSSGFTQNNWQNLYGDLYLGGYASTMDRLMNVNIGIDVDLKSIAKGLSYRTYFGTDHYNRYTTSQKNEYAVYIPETGNEGSIQIAKEGNNNFVGNQTMTGVNFCRRYGWTNILGYDRKFSGNNELSVELTSIYYTYKENNTIYTDRNMNFGFRSNYMNNKRYVAEYSSAYIGASHLKDGNRWGYAQAWGLAWIATEEDLLKNIDNLDYLKFKASFGNTKSDRSDGYTGYHLFENTYSAGSAYNYGDNAGSNAIMIRNSGNNPNLSFTQNNQFNAGFETSLLGDKIFVETNYFNNLRYDMVERLTSSYPAYWGGDNFIPSDNYGRWREQGIEAGINFRQKFGEFTLDASLNAIWTSTKILRTNEDDYGPGMGYRQSVGKSVWSVWGLQADGLYTQAEIDQINDPRTNVVYSTYGIVRAGDIKYLDLNKDGKVDDNDITVIGSSHPTSAYSFTINTSWRNFNLWAYINAQLGRKTVDGSTAVNDYYWITGEKKYPAHLLERWTSDNPDVNAAYPRLTVSEIGNNYRNSTFWVSDKSYFSMPAIQLTYTFDEHIASALAMKKVMIFLRAENLFKVGPNADILQLNVGSEPQMRWYYIGIKAQF